MDITALSQSLLSDFGLYPVIATEIEFYLHGAGASLKPEAVLARLRETCEAAGIDLYNAEQERGPDQYEISLLHSPDIERIIEDTERFKRQVAEAFLPHGIKADFAAKPMLDAPGSGLHVHLHLEDETGKNVFFREGDVFSPHLLHSIGGLLARMNACMPVFAPTQSSYARFTHTENRYLVCPAAANVPQTVSWGTNNRTVAIRLPNAPPDHKRLEHRVAGSDADVRAVVAAVLDGVQYGLANQCDPGEPVYGDASLAQYGLQLLLCK